MKRLATAAVEAPMPPSARTGMLGKTSVWGSLEPLAFDAWADPLVAVAVPEEPEEPSDPVLAS